MNQQRDQWVIWLSFNQLLLLSAGQKCMPVATNAVFGCPYEAFSIHRAGLTVNQGSVV